MTNINDIFRMLGLPIGQSLGGYILVRKPAFNTGEIRNYTICFIICLVTDIIAALWVLLMVSEKFAEKQEAKIEMKLIRINEKLGNQGSKIKLRSQISKQDEHIHPMKLLFDLENVKSMIKTITKKRLNKGRIQIWFMIISMAIIVGEYSGEQVN